MAIVSPDQQNNMAQHTSQNRSGITNTPVLQQRIKPLGVATPLVMASPIRR